MFKKLQLLLLILFVAAGSIHSTQASSLVVQPKYEESVSGKPGGQYSAFPVPLPVLKQEEAAQNIEGVWDKIVFRAKKDPFNVAATVIFILAVIHTFLTSYFVRISHYFAEKHEKKMAKKGILIEHPSGHYPVSFLSSVFHFLGEVEAVFGIWVIPLLLAAIKFHSFHDFQLYLDHDCSFVEPMFVTVIMIVASSRPLFRFAEGIMSSAARVGRSTPGAWWLSVMCIAPLLGSIVTEPAAMTIGAMILAKRFYALKPSSMLAYASLGLLFVNISIGGTMTHFAAPPVVMVAEKWNWGLVYMITHFGWKAAAAILVSSALYFVFFRKEFKRLNIQEAEVSHAALPPGWEGRKDKVPVWVTVIHLLFLAWTVIFAHVPVMFIGGFVFFLGFIIATPHHQNSVLLRIPIMVGFFLAGLVILGGMQAWWLEPVLTSMDNSNLVMLGATVLTAFNDNAAVTYLASTVGDLSEAMKYAIVAGAVTGGGLTVIANAPNPAGQAILGKYFLGINPLKLFLAALVPTAIVYLCFTFLVTL